MSSFADYFARAESMLAAGFTSESARKDALDLLNRAHERTEREVMDVLLAIPHDDRDDAWRKLYYGFKPLHVWSDRHAAPYAARFPHQVTQADRAAKLRATIKAAALVPKKPSEKRAAADAKREAEAKTCQVCGRSIFAETGKIAHHGYQRPGDGYQTPSCFGARHLPFEADRSVLKEYIEALDRMIEGEREYLAKVSTEEVPIERSYEAGAVTNDGEPVYSRGRRVMTKVTIELTRANYAEMKEKHPPYFKWTHRRSFEEELVFEIVGLQRHLEHHRSYRKGQWARYVGWRKTLEWANPPASSSAGHWRKV